MDIFAYRKVRTFLGDVSPYKTVAVGSCINSWYSASNQERRSG